MINEGYLVVGGTHGTGLFYVNDLIEKGARVEVVGRRENPAFKAPLPVYHQCNLEDQEQLRTLLGRLIKQSAPFRHLVFFQRYRGESPSWEEEIQVCLGATKEFMEIVPDLFRDSEDCSVVVVGSIAQDYIFPDQSAAYHVTKSGLRQLVRYYALRYGKLGTRVNLVVPATILKPEAKEFYRENPDLVDQKSAASPLGRMGTPEDMAGAINFLLGESANFITGHDLIVDGGISLVGHEYAVSESKNAT